MDKELREKMIAKARENGERVWTVDEIISVLETSEDTDEHAIWFDKHGR